MREHKPIYVASMLVYPFDSTICHVEDYITKSARKITRFRATQNKKLGLVGKNNKKLGLKKLSVSTSLLLSSYFGPFSYRAIRFGSYRLIFSRKFPLSVSGAGSMTLKRSTSRTGGSNSENEQFRALEQESFTNKSSELRNVLVNGGGIEAIVNRLSKWVVSALFGSMILLRHDGSALWALIGSVLNSALSVALKRILNQKRPETTSRSDPGMPSSHAQSISFISVFAVLTVMEWLGTSGVSLSLSGLILALGSYFIWLRVSQKLHTSSQVVVGGIVGSVFCILWSTTWNLLLLEAFKSSLLFQISLFMVAASFALAFAIYVLLNWFEDNR